MRIALTGGVAEGKSTVLEYLGDLGVETDSADLAAKRVFDIEAVQHRIAAVSGFSLPLDRTELLTKMAESTDLRRAVNKIMHPQILKEILLSKAKVVEVPLLLEACIQQHFDRIWAVTCGPEEQQRRLADRLRSEDQAASIIKSQLTTRIKTAFADEIIRTNSPRGSVKRVTSTLAFDAGVV
jgi:dephospho-CoA kinase